MAYTTATILAKDQPFADGRVRIVVRFTGDAGEPARDVDRVIDATDTVAGLRRWAYDTAANLGARKTVADLLTVGQVVTLTPPPAPPAPTALETWRALAGKLQRARDLGTLTSPAAVADVATLEGQVNSTYQVGFLL